MSASIPARNIDRNIANLDGSGDRSLKLDDLIAAGALGAIERLIGAAQQQVCRVPVVGIERNPDRHRELAVNFLVQRHPKIGYRSPNALRTLISDGRSYIRQHDRELLATVA